MNDAYALSRQELIDTVRALDVEVPMQETHRALVLMTLNSVRKIRKFRKWVAKNKKSGIMQATEEEIVSAALKISK